MNLSCILLDAAQIKSNERVGNYKLSQFNSIVPITDSVDVVYNAYSGRFMLLRKGVINQSIDELVKNRGLLEDLIEGGFVVGKSMDEIERVKKLSRKIDEDDSKFNLIINPTLNCNFKCWYCYETKKIKSLMTAKVFQNVKLLIQSKASLYPVFHLSFFGGEPLLGYKKIVKPLIEYTNKVCSISETELMVSFTSNGYLITRDMVQFFKDNHVKHFQITLDGNKDLHNKTRYQSRGSDSYSKIIENVKLLLESGIGVTLRLNYTDKNINSLRDVVEDFLDVDFSQKEQLFISFHQVWQNATVDIKDEVNRTVEYCNSRGFQASVPIFNNVKCSCYADKKNSALINYNGDVFKCTAIDFEKTKRDRKSVV